MKKNIIAIMMAVVALFATQCKKQTEPMTNQPAGETMKVTVRVENNTAKTEITAAGAVTWKEGDKLYVVGSEQGLLGYVSALTNGKSVNFEGSIIPLSEPQMLRFYYVGDKKFILDGEGNYTFDLSAQDGTLEGIAAHNQLMFSTTSGNVAVGTTNFGTIQMTSLMAIAYMEFIFPSEGNKTINAGGAVKVTDGYATSTFNTKDCNGASSITGTKGTITMTSSSPITKCYIALLPGKQTLSFTNYNNIMYSGSLDEEDVVANKFYNSENPIEVELAIAEQTPALFTVNSSGKQVYFSPGNLQAVYNGSSYDWRFAPHQYNIVGNAPGNTNIGNHESGNVVDLFFWSTDNANNNWGILKNSNNTNTTGTFNDWGNITSLPDNGGSKKWRTLTGNTGGEWDYLINTRSGDKAPDINGTTDCRFALIQWNNGNTNPDVGMLVFPDEFEWPFTVTSYPAKFNDTQVQSVSYTETEIEALGEAGAVYLPCAGKRTNGAVSNCSGAGSIPHGRYWSSTASGDTKAYNIRFYNKSITGDNSDYRYSGSSVRLVKDAD